MNDSEKLMQSLLTNLEPHMSAVDFDVWIKTLVPVRIDGTRLILCASSERMRNFVVQKFKDVLTGALIKISPLMTEVLLIEPSERGAYESDETQNIHVAEPQSAADMFIADHAPQSVSASAPISDPDLDSELPPLSRTDVTLINPKYNFGNFVVGKSNQFMYATASAVAESPGKGYNPLFIFGGSGLGKTHIMHAIGNYVHAAFPSKRVVYVSSEKFLNEFIESVRKGKGKEFRDRYREIDVLMIDDIQFIAGKPGVQEELFHTFNALYGAEKQLVFTSDRPPKEIRDLEERLQSRFVGGMMADVQLPDVETRTAILQEKSLALQVVVDPAVLQYMAEQVASNIRDLEGLLNRVIFLARLNDSAPTVELVQEALKDAPEKSEESVSADKVIECVCRYYNISKDDLIGKKKTREIAEPRQICMYLVGEIVGLPLARVGESFGGRDHTTVMHARNKVLGLIQTNLKVKLAINDIKEMVFKIQ